MKLKVFTLVQRVFSEISGTSPGLITSLYLFRFLSRMYLALYFTKDCLTSVTGTFLVVKGDLYTTCHVRACVTFSLFPAESLLYISNTKATGLGAARATRPAPGGLVGRNAGFERFALGPVLSLQASYVVSSEDGSGWCFAGTPPAFPQPEDILCGDVFLYFLLVHAQSPGNLIGLLHGCCACWVDSDRAVFIHLIRGVADHRRYHRLAASVYAWPTWVLLRGSYTCVPASRVETSNASRRSPIHVGCQ